jgi:hypothetical protein
MMVFFQPSMDLSPPSLLWLAHGRQLLGRQQHQAEGIQQNQQGPRLGLP